VILAGSALFVLGSLICLVAPGMPTLLAGRLIQGIGVSAPTTLAIAVVGDLYPGNRAAIQPNRIGARTHPHGAVSQSVCSPVRKVSDMPKNFDSRSPVSIVMARQPGSRPQVRAGRARIPDWPRPH
jgi:hypothetical protein